MASFVLFEGSDLARQLNDGETGFIAQTGSLATLGAAIEGTGAIGVTVFGSVYSATAEAIEHNGTEFDLYIGAGAGLAASDDDTVASNVTVVARVINEGFVSSFSDALDLRASDEGATIEILNSGVLSGLSDGIVTDAGDEIARITNHGVITGIDGGIDHLDGDASVVNFGEIAGQDFYGYDGAEGVDTIRNFGSIEGGVFTQGGDDIVVNRGRIDSVDLGAGDDTYNGARGVVDRAVRGGPGADALNGGAEDDRLRGDGGADVLAGRRGDDSLRGDGGADRFVFAANGGFDTVEDFGGRDRIDLTALGLAGFRASVRDRIEDGAGGALIDFRGPFGLQILLEGVEAADLGRNDFLI